MYVLHHLRTDHSPLHQMVSILLSWYQEVAGISEPALESHLLLPHADLDAPWIMTLRNYLREAKSKLLLPSQPQPQLRRERPISYEHCLKSRLQALGIRGN